MNKDIEVIRLRYAIQQFQEYDKGRKKIMDELRNRINVLEEYIKELEKPLSKKWKKRLNLVCENGKLNKKINQLELVIQHEGYRVPVVAFEWSQWKVEVENRKLREQNESLVEENKRLKNEVHNLITKLREYEQLFKHLWSS